MEAPGSRGARDATPVGRSLVPLRLTWREQAEKPLAQQIFRVIVGSPAFFGGNGSFYKRELLLSLVGIVWGLEGKFLKGNKLPNSGLSKSLRKISKVFNTLSKADC